MRTRLTLDALEARDVPAANVFAIGSEPGTGSTAALIDADTGATRFTVTPFDVSATDGLAIHVAVGDVNGDRVPDLIAAPGAGGGPVVKVFDGMTGNEIRSFSVFDPRFRGGLTVAAGDINLDGIADIFAAAGPGGGPAVAVIDGKTSATVANFFAFDPSFSGGVNIAAGDVDGDGRADAIVAAGPGGGPHVKAFGIVAGSAPRELRSFFAYDAALTGGVSVSGGDADGDGITDIITGAGRGGAPHVRCFRASDLAITSSFFAANPDDRGGVRVSTVNTGHGADCHLLTAAAGAVVEYTGAGQHVAAVYGRALPLGGPAVATDNAALMWGEVALEAVKSEGTPPPRVGRVLAIVHTAIFDAVNSITQQYAPYHYGAVSPTGADADAAALAAGEAALSALYPNLTANFQTIRNAQLALIADSPAKSDGIAVGQGAAADILALRQNDGAATAQFPYTPGTAPGDWQPTPPANAAYLLPGWGNVTPFAITSAAAYRPAPPPALDSQAYADALNQVKSLGAAANSPRTADQSQIAVFWRAGGGTVTPPGMTLQLAHQAVRRADLPLLESARTLALVSLAEADAGIVAWDAKATYEFWRPITAIRAADTDGNALTDADPAWSSFIATPPFPAYTSGHSTFSSAGAAVLEGLFGESYSFRTFSQDVPGVSRSFASFAEAAAEAGISRIYGGIHYSFDNAAGLSSGAAIGEHIVGNLLQPIVVP